jgi:hypothetical protein
MGQTAGEIQENHIPVDLRCCNDRRISWNACQPDKISISMELIQTFRILTALTIGMFWGILAVLFGSLCDRFTPTQNRAIAMV